MKKLFIFNRFVEGNLSIKMPVAARIIWTNSSSLRITNQTKADTSSCMLTRFIVALGTKTDKHSNI